MRITRAAVTVLTLSMLLLASLAVAGSTLAGGRSFTTQLLGVNEVPVSGDPDGSGTARITLNPGTGQVCYSYTVSNVGPLLAGHIHDASAGSAGPVVVTLAPTSATGGSGCVAADRELIKDILKNPSDYYVNVHNMEFPGGAVRGQLR